MMTTEVLAIEDPAQGLGAATRSEKQWCALPIDPEVDAKAEPLVDEVSVTGSAVHIAGAEAVALLMSGPGVQMKRIVETRVGPSTTNALSATACSLPQRRVKTTLWGKAI